MTLATNMELIESLSRKVLAISEVGDLEATATSIPLSLRACNMPFACGYIDGISRLERHSLQSITSVQFPIRIQNLTQREREREYQ